MKVRSLTHWGVYDFHVRNGQIVDVTPDPSDPDPSPIGRNLLLGNSTRRVERPAVRRSYLESGPRSRKSSRKSSRNLRGNEGFVEVDWDTALNLVAAELQRVRSSYGNRAIYGGSYGWASAGRFHHTLSQLHRFLNCIGGYTASKNAYSFAAAEVILPHVIGDYEGLLKSPTSWDNINRHTDTMVCFGGVPLRNSQITNGGLGKHRQRRYMQQARDAGLRFINISPARDDTHPTLDATWIPIRPGTDVALMLGLAHTLISQNLHDLDFLENYCMGFDALADYILGRSDGVTKTSAWASQMTGIEEQTITELAQLMAGSRTMISLSWSLSRHQHGEQPYWMGMALAAMLGQIGLPGGGIGLGYGVENKVGKNVERRRIASLPSAGPNSEGSFIPVARIADMLLNPGETFEYNGSSYRYPDIKLIYWAGGNPFHHHQDLNRLKAAWQKPDTVICHELVWNSHALHADIVLPAASSLERNDLGGAPNEDLLIAMKKVVEPIAEARTDFEIFTQLSERLGSREAFTEGRNEMQWIRHLYEQTRKGHPELPEFDSFWQTGEHHFDEPSAHVLFEHFRNDPMANPMRTPSGRIQLQSDQFGVPTWYEPAEWLGKIAEYPFHLISHQPETRLHSQLDHGEYSQSQKIHGFEPIRMNPADAAANNLIDGDIVKVFNQRGGFLAGLVVTDQVMPGVLMIATGAWWSPDSNGLCESGNPNAVTLDVGTSTIAQGPSALTCLVNVEKCSEKCGESRLNL